MGRRAKNTTIVVHEGVNLTLHAGKYHCNFRLGGRSFRKSTKTGNLADAKFRSLEMYQKAQRRLEAGEDAEIVAFSRLKREYLEQIHSTDKCAYHSATLDRHVLPFFARYDNVSEIKRSDIVDYIKFRRAKGEAPPSPQTINRENTVLRQMLRYAHDKGWLSTVPRIDNEDERLSRRRRRHFTIEEYRILYRTARKRISEIRDNAGLKLQREQRKLLRDYIMILANTGLRVDEAGTLIWRNVNFDEHTLLLERAGKTKSTRRVFMRAGAVRALRRIRARRNAYLAERGESLDPASKVITMANGKEVKSFKKGFDQLLIACGFKYNTIADKHALTSLRHTYATFRLTSRTSKRASLRSLAKQMGTSERMIERHYGHDVIEDYREELIG